MRFILHVWTKNTAIPWMVHIDGKDLNVHNVALRVPTWTRASEHTPCANWYIAGECKYYYFIGRGDTLVLSDEPQGV